MQVLHMSEDSQTMIVNMMKELYGDSYKMRDFRSYRDTRRGLGRFRVLDRQLMVRGVLKNEQEVNKYAINQLTKYGFHASRVTESLEACNDDCGEAIERLMTHCFDLSVSDDHENTDEHKLDEKMALESIYGETFKEKIPGKLWQFELEVPTLEKYIRIEEKPKRQLAKDVCRFFIQGTCRYGNKCRNKHIVDSHLNEPEKRKVFVLEIRFYDQCTYPTDTPMVLFSCPLKEFPPSYSLKITTRLMHEAKSLAQDSAPSIFALINLLQDDYEVQSVVDGPESSFSFAADLVPSHVIANESRDPSEALFAGLNIRDSTQKDSKKQRAIDKKLNQRILKNFKPISEDSKMIKIRKELPSWKMQSKILKAVENAQVVVISGMTGCGKSTQVPQYILDQWLSSADSNVHCNIVCTQPRRISAIGVAERVATEREERVGAGLVGYQIRLENKVCNNTRLTFCTTGILLRRLESDPDLEDVSHVVVDEVHERSQDSDFLLMLLKDLIPKRPDLKVILMSATVNADLFANYFKSTSKVPIVEIPGRTFPVNQVFLEDIIEMTNFAVEENSEYARPQEKFGLQQGFSNDRSYDAIYKGLGEYADMVDESDLQSALASGAQIKPAKVGQKDEHVTAEQVFERYRSSCPARVAKTLSKMDFNKINYDLIETMLVYITENYEAKGSVLVFLPGMQEIVTLHDQIVGHPVLGAKAGKFKIIPLHSSLTSEEQSQVFQTLPGKVRKLVLSTNLAETSITIDDCVFVVEVGRMKEKGFDSVKNMESLDTVWVSRANALQRKGRAGRVMEGHCFHLYTKFRYDHHLRKDPLPEIQRVPLEQAILRIKILPLFEGRKTHKVIQNMLEPPDTVAIDSAIARLQDVAALDSETELTPLGWHLAGLPVDVRIGKVLLFGAIFRCLDSALTIAAALSFKSPFSSPFGKRDEAMKKKLEYSIRNSDILAVLRAYEGWSKACKIGGKAGFVYAKENFLSVKTLQTIATMKHQFAEHLSGIGFLDKSVTFRRLEKASRTSYPDAIAQVTGPEVNSNNTNYKLVVCVLAASLYPNVVQILSPETKYKQTAAGAIIKPVNVEDLKFRTKRDGYVNIHPSSVNFKVGQYETPYLIYHEKVRTSRVFVRELCMVPVYPMVLFGGADGVNVELQRGQFVLNLEDGWIKFVTSSHTIAECLKEMRSELDNLLEEKIREPQLNLNTYARGKLVINTLVKLLSNE